MKNQSVNEIEVTSEIYVGEGRANFIYFQQKIELLLEAAFLRKISD